MEDAVMQQTGTEAIPTAALPGSEDEQRLTDEIAQLWEVHGQAKTTVKKTKEDLKAIRELVSERLYELKRLLARPGRCGQWSSWLKERKISRATADRLVQRYGANLPGYESPHEAISNSQADSAEKLARVVWSRFRKVLETHETVVQFLASITEISGVPYEWRAEGLLILKPAPKLADELPGSAPETDPAPQPSEEVTVIAEEPKEEPASASSELGLAVAAAETNSGDVV